MQVHSEGAVRHAEKRRRGTCEFANRIARMALQKYEETVPKSYRNVHKQTCVAAVVACIKESGDTTYSGVSESEVDTLDHLQVIGLGVGTKFLSATTLQDEPNDCTRIRDCHAEVLARRAFRRQLLLEMENDLHKKAFEDCNYVPILERIEHDNQQTRSEAKRLKSSAAATDKAFHSRPKYRLKPGVTIHFYASSAPCGNATLKKFVKMEKEVFDSSLSPNQWPRQEHAAIAAHSLRLGQFALLVKKDSSLQTPSNEINDTSSKSPKPSDAVLKTDSDNTKTRPKAKPWPCRQDDSWCPPSCSITHYNKGTIHSCSDKLCRWNCLGLQGSLMMTMLDEPLYMTTLTVGRKFSRAICQRAVCCRAEGFRSSDGMSKFKLNHPVLMETNVYMDETGNMEGVKVIGQDASFDSSNSCWVWWPGIVPSYEYAAECIDGKTGLLIHHDDSSAEPQVSEVSNQSYTTSMLELLQEGGESTVSRSVLSLEEVASLKQQLSSDYHAAKAQLLKHRIFREWSCRSSKS